MRSLLIPVLIPLAAFAAQEGVTLPEPFATPSEIWRISYNGK